MMRSPRYSPSGFSNAFPLRMTRATVKPFEKRATVLVLKTHRTKMGESVERGRLQPKVGMATDHIIQ
jgi:hypothetical protein